MTITSHYEFREIIMFNMRSLLGSTLTLMAVFAMGACGGEATDYAAEGEEIGTVQQALSQGIIPDGTYKSNGTAGSTLKTIWKNGTCLNGDYQEIYRFKAEYPTQHLTGDRAVWGDLKVRCSDWTVEAKTSRNEYPGQLHMEPYAIRPISMYWKTSVGVTWLLQ